MSSRNGFRGGRRGQASPFQKWGGEAARPTDGRGLAGYHQ